MQSACIYMHWKLLPYHKMTAYANSPIRFHRCCCRHYRVNTHAETFSICYTTGYSGFLSGRAKSRFQFLTPRERSQLLHTNLLFRQGETGHLCDKYQTYFKYLTVRVCDTDISEQFCSPKMDNLNLRKIYKG